MFWSSTCLCWQFFQKDDRTLLIRTLSVSFVFICPKIWHGITHDKSYNENLVTISYLIEIQGWTEVNWHKTWHGSLKGNYNVSYTLYKLDKLCSSWVSVSCFMFIRFVFVEFVTLKKIKCQPCQNILPVYSLVFVHYIEKYHNCENAKYYLLCMAENMRTIM